MDIDVPIRELGPVESDALIQAVLAQDEGAWREETHRQQAYDVHRETESIVLIFTDLAEWPSIEVKK
jgi:hypothetical protein